MQSQGLRYYVYAVRVYVTSDWLDSLWLVVIGGIWQLSETLSYSRFSFLNLQLFSSLLVISTILYKCILCPNYKILNRYMPFTVCVFAFYLFSIR